MGGSVSPSPSSPTPTADLAHVAVTPALSRPRTRRHRDRSAKRAVEDPCISSRHDPLPLRHHRLHSLAWLTFANAIGVLLAVMLLVPSTNRLFGIHLRPLDHRPHEPRALRLVEPPAPGLPLQGLRRRPSPPPRDGAAPSSGSGPPRSPSAPSPGSPATPAASSSSTGPATPASSSRSPSLAVWLLLACAFFAHGTSLPIPPRTPRQNHRPRATAPQSPSSSTSPPAPTSTRPSTPPPEAPPAPASSSPRWSIVAILLSCRSASPTASTPAPAPSPLLDHLRRRVPPLPRPAAAPTSAIIAPRNTSLSAACSSGSRSSPPTSPPSPGTPTPAAGASRSSAGGPSSSPPAGPSSFPLSSTTSSSPTASSATRSSRWPDSSPRCSSSSCPAARRRRLDLQPHLVLLRLEPRSPRLRDPHVHGRLARRLRPGLHHPPRHGTQPHSTLAA